MRKHSKERHPLFGKHVRCTAHGHSFATLRYGQRHVKIILEDSAAIELINELKVGIPETPLVRSIE